MRSASAFARFLAPLHSLLTGLLVACSVVMAVVWLSGFGEATLSDPALARSVPNRELGAALVAFARGVDALWIVLAAINLYVALVQTEGIAVARRWSVAILLAGFILPALSALSGWPLGPVFYPENLGLRIGPVPFAVPLLWFVIIVGSREAAWRMSPRVGHGTLAWVTGVAVLVTVVNLDPLASEYRAWWIWYPSHSTSGPTWQYRNFASWLLVGLALAWLMRTSNVVPRVKRRPNIPVAALVFLNLLALITRAVLR